MSKVTTETEETISDKLPEGWTVTAIGTEGQPEYLVTHDGRDDNGVTFSAGCTFRVGSLDNLSEYIKYQGIIPVGHKLNPEPK